MFPTVRFKLPGKRLVGRPRSIVGIVCVMAVVGFLAAGIVAWLSYDLTAGLPNREAVEPGSTTCRRRRPSSTSPIGPNLHDLQRTTHRGSARESLTEPDQGGAVGRRSTLLRARRHRSDPHRPRRAFAEIFDGATELKAAARDHAAARASEATLSRDKTYQPQDEGSQSSPAYIENLYEKKDILELYLNKVYFGDGLYGVEAASQGCLGRGAAELPVDEAALLAGLMQSPSKLRTDRQPTSRDRAPRRRSANHGVIRGR